MKKIISLCLTVFISCGIFTGCAGTDAPRITTDELPPMAVMIDDTLYYHTGQRIELVRCGVMDGEIIKTVPVTELPDTNNQSNFGTGYEYQYGDEHHIDIVIDSQWIRFCTGECNADHSQTLTEELYSHQVGDFAPDYDTEIYDSADEKVCFYPLKDDIKTVTGQISIVE